tara:strand:+ start:222 stop:551 length:330 start_codon:yes stop_codon:yes gene_type:complete
MVVQPPLSASELLSSMNKASVEKKKLAMKTIWLGGAICLIGLVFTALYEIIPVSSTNDTYFIIMDSIEEILCCGGPLTFLVGVAMLIAQGKDGQYVSILPIKDPPDGPH